MFVFVFTGSETTANQADVKEGFLFGSEEKGESPMCGYNVFPSDSDIPNFNQVIKQFMEKLSDIGWEFLIFGEGRAGGQADSREGRQADMRRAVGKAGDWEGAHVGG